MSRFLLRKSVAESQWLLLACGLALFAYCWLRVWLVSQLEMRAFQTIILEVWDDFQKFSPVPLSHLFTYTGRIARTYTEPVVVVCVAGWAIARGSDCVSGELGRGTLEMVLAQPVSRRSLVLTNCLVTTAGSALLAVAVWAGIWIGIHTNSVEQTVTRPLLRFSAVGLEIPNPWAEEEVRTSAMAEHVAASEMAPGSLNLFCLACFFGGLSTLLSAADRYRWRTIGLVIGILLVQSTVQYVALALPAWNWLGWLTIFSSYNPELFISMCVEDPHSAAYWLRLDEAGGFLGAGPLGGNALLLGLGACGYAAAATLIARRDLPAPL